MKSYDPETDFWAFEPALVDPRWYPTMASLADGRLLAVGGGTENNRSARARRRCATR